MPEKSRQRRVQIAKRQGKATAIKSSDVGLASGLSTHAAKKSRHVEGLRKVADRSVDRKMPPGQSKRGAKVPGGLHESSELPVGGAAPGGARVAGFERSRARQQVISRRSPSSVAAKVARKKK